MSSTKAPQLVAFLRGINLGKRRVKMDALREHFEAMGFADVETFIASGNVIFRAGRDSSDVARLETRIESALHESLGFPVSTFVRTTRELADIAQYRPFAKELLDNTDYSLHVAFLRNALPAQEQKLLESFRTEMDELHVHGRELYWLCRGRISESLIKWPKLEKSGTFDNSARNITTIRRLVEKYPA